MSYRQPSLGVEERIASYDFGPAIEADRLRKEQLAQRLAAHPVIPVTSGYDYQPEAMTQVPAQTAQGVEDFSNWGATRVSGEVAIYSRP